MDPITPIIGMAPPEWIPVLVIAYLLYKAWQAWTGRKQPEQPTDEITKDPDVRG